jgi:hypothetical protein
VKYDSLYNTRDINLILILCTFAMFLGNMSNSPPISPSIHIKRTDELNAFVKSRNKILICLDFRFVMVVTVGSTVCWIVTPYSSERAQDCI